jgi:hypothetical protein
LCKNWPGVAGLKRPDGIRCQRGGPSADIEVTSPCVGRHSRLPMPQHRAKRRGGATEGQAARPAFDHHRSCPLSYCQTGPTPTREDMAGQRVCPRRRIDDPNLVVSVPIHCTARTCANDAPRGRVASDHWRFP